MPTYEYVCPHCGASFDLFQSMRDAPITECPKCHQMGVKRLVGAGAGLIFKGSGFYITDYRNKPGGKEGGEAKPGGTGDAKAPATSPSPAGGAATTPAPSPAPASAPAPTPDKK